MKYGRWTLIEESKKGYWKMSCDCGTVKDVYLANVVKGKSSSCGCYAKEVTSKTARTHGMSKTDEYATWNRMWNRCTNPIVDRYPIYGGRGITVCERWAKFENFIEDMGMKPSKSHSIGRIDNDGNYEPSNCRWETPDEQKSNTSTTVRVQHKGEVLTIHDLQKRTGLSRAKIYGRSRLGITGDRLESKSSLTERPITYKGQTKLTTEWMKSVPIPISSFYYYQRRGLTVEQVIEKFVEKAELKKARLAS